MHGNVVWTTTHAKIIVALMKLDQVEKEMAEVNDDKERPLKHPMLSVRNSCTPSPLRYALTKNPVGSGTTM
jgi:hypothetical protein